MMMMMNVTNVSLSNQSSRQNNPLLPANIRGLIVGKGNCGKTVLLLNLLLKDDWLDYNNLLVFGNSLHQPEYRVIEEGFKKGLGKSQILSIFENQHMFTTNISPLELIESYTDSKDGGIKGNFYGNCQLIPDPKSLDVSLKNLLILDDCFLGKQSKAEAYYTRGRHNNCDTLYISQNYFALPRQSIRENSNFIILFPQNTKSVEHIYRDHCTDISYDEFKQFCEIVWSTKHNFITIDLTSTPLYGKYRKNLNTIYVPKKFLIKEQE